MKKVLIICLSKRVETLSGLMQKSNWTLSNVIEEKLNG